MKKLITLLGLVATVATSSAATYKEQLLLNGWNVLLPTNTSVYVGETNTTFTYIHGEIFLSLTNNSINGTLSSNTAPDPFGVFGKLASDLNGDVAANAAIHYYINQTNWIPIAVTNSQGQWFIYTGNTNGLPSGETVPAAGWPLVPSQYPTYMYPATTNLYTALPNSSSTNLITFNFQRGWSVGSGGTTITVWDTSTNLFTFAVLATGTTPLAGITNLPTTFTQGADRVRCTSIVGGVTINNGVSIINQVSLGQPQP